VGRAGTLLHLAGVLFAQRAGTLWTFALGLTIRTMAILRNLIQNTIGDFIHTRGDAGRMS